MESVDEFDLAPLLKRAELFLHKLADRIGKPIAIIDSDRVRGFRFAKPGVLHYVVLNSSRSISILNSMKLLKEKGYRGEFGILSRALRENCSKLSYVVGGISEEGLDRKSTKFLEEFFGDNERNVEKRPKYIPISHKDIHRRNSENVSQNLIFLNKFGLDKNISNEFHQHAKLESNLYNVFSNHVHGRYPEMMDVYGDTTFKPRLDGNRESHDLDGNLEDEFLYEMFQTFETGFKVAWLKLKIGKLMEFTSTEASYIFGEIDWS